MTVGGVEKRGEIVLENGGFGVVGVLVADGLAVERFGLFDLSGGLERLRVVVTARGGWFGGEGLAEVFEGGGWIGASLGEAGEATGGGVASFEERVGLGLTALRGDGFGEE